MTSPGIRLLAPPARVALNDFAGYFPDHGSLSNWINVRHRQVRPTHFTALKGATAATLVDIARSDTGAVHFITADERHPTDSFWTAHISASDSAVLAGLIGRRAIIAMKIKLRNGNHGHTGSRYLIDSNFALVPLPLNPTIEELAAIGPGLDFTVEGVFHGYTTINETTRGLRTAEVVVETAHGLIGLRCVQSRRSSQLTYGGGVLETIVGEDVLVGERIRVTGFKGPENHALFSAGVPYVGYRRPYLLAPTPRRQAAYDALRVDVKEMLGWIRRYIRSETWDTARDIFASTRRLGLTYGEAMEAADIMQHVRKEYRSVYCQNPSIAADLLRWYDFDPESMTRKHYCDFTARALAGSIWPRVNPSEVDPGHIFQFWRERHNLLRQADLEVALVNALPARLGLLEENTEDDARRHFNRLMLRRCIEQTTDMVAPGQPLIAALADLSEHCIMRRYYDMPQGTYGNLHDRGLVHMDGFLEACLSSLANFKKSAASFTMDAVPAIAARWQKLVLESDETRHITPLLGQLAGGPPTP